MKSDRIPYSYFGWYRIDIQYKYWMGTVLLEKWVEYSYFHYLFYNSIISLSVLST